MTDNEKNESETQFEDTARDESRRAGIGLGTYVVSAALLVIFIVVIGFGFISRRKAEADLKQSTAAAAIPSSMWSIQRPALRTMKLCLPGNTQGFYRCADLCADERLREKLARRHRDACEERASAGRDRDAGRWTSSLQQARADLQTAQANLRQAEITADRWEALWKTNSVSKQETDVGGERLPCDESHGRLKHLQCPALGGATGVSRRFMPLSTA
jgi:hypothetical protein